MYKAEGQKRHGLCCPAWVKNASGEEEALELGLDDDKETALCT